MPSHHRPKLILASTSPTRRMLLSGSGVAFSCEPPRIDESAAKANLAAVPLAELASELAAQKSLDVSARFPEAIVIGADQTLELDGAGFDKPSNIEAARRQLMQLRGRMHHLHAALCCSRNGKILWQHRSTASLTMRSFSSEELDRYLEQAGDKPLQSVGAYQIEGPAIGLFSAITGDYFTILGLPLLPLLQFLRDQGIPAP